MRCFLFGHSDTREDIVPVLEQTVRRHIEQDHVNEFVVGHYGNFDYLARQVIHALKPSYPQIRLTLLLPYYPLSCPVPPEFDDTIYPEGLESVPKPYAIVRANQLVIDHCDFVICCVRFDASSSGKLLKRALLRQHQGRLCVTNIVK